MQPLQNGGRSEGQGVSVHRFTRLTPFPTFGVIALHQARLSDLYVEGFVLLILLVVDYFHLDGFTEEEEEERGEESKEGGRKKRRQKSEERTGWKLENLEKTEKSSSLVFPQAPKA